MFDKAIALHKQGRFDKAEAEYLNVLNTDFDHLDVLYLLGTCYLQRGLYGLAANLFKQAIILKDAHFEAWNNIGNCYKAINKDVDAETCWKYALNIKDKKPVDYADIYNNLATLYVNAGNPEKGLEFVEKCLEVCPDHVDGNWNKSLLLLEQGKYGEGFDLYHWGFNTKNRGNREFGKTIPFWDGTPGKNVVVWGEQGMGDEILFASMIPDLCRVSKSVVYECHPRMVKIFKESFKFDNLHIYGTRKDAFVNWPELHPDINARLAMGDMGKFFRRELKDFPRHYGYLKASPDRVEHYKEKLAKISNRVKVGISWTGGYIKTRKDYRSISLIDMEDILAQDADFISLQYTPEAYNTIAEAEDKLDCRIYHWPSAVQAEDYNETAALVQALDVVVTVNTCVYHLAGAMGKNVWVMTPKAKAWRYYSPDGKSFPWYPSAVCMEQEKLYEWGPVVKRVTEDLKSLIRMCK